MWAQVSAEPPALTSRRPDLPAEVNEVLAKALAKVPADRYATCPQFAAALRRACGLESGPGIARGAGPGRPGSRPGWSRRRRSALRPSRPGRPPPMSRPARPTGPAPGSRGEVPRSRAPEPGSRGDVPRSRPPEPGSSGRVPRSRRAARGSRGKRPGRPPSRWHSACWARAGQSVPDRPRARAAPRALGRRARAAPRALGRRARAAPRAPPGRAVPRSLEPALARLARAAGRPARAA